MQNLLLAVFAAAIIALWTRWEATRLGRADFLTGYLLLTALVFLAAYNLRKKLPVLSWSTTAGWLQVHIYVALVMVVVFGLHIGWHFPNGVLETTLALLFASTFLSGLVGLYWTRTIPPLLSRVSEEFIYERIPLIRTQILERAEREVLETVRSTGSSTLGDFFTTRLHGFFTRSRGVGYLLRPNSRLRRQLLSELTEIGRYLSEPEKQASEMLFALIRRRDDLDFHAAMQWRLKAWLFVHLGLTMPLLLFAGLHGLLAHLFAGGVP